MENHVSPRKPFGFATNFKDYEDNPFKNAVAIYTNAGKKYIKRSQITQNQEWLDSWKVLTPMASPGSGDYPNMILGPSFVAEPNSCCAETYLVAGIFKTEKEARLLQ